MSCLISIDMGTSSAKALLCTTQGQIIAQASASYPCYYPQLSWAEQDARDVLAGAVKVISELGYQAKLHAYRIDAISLGGIWQSLLPLDHEGQPLSRALLWSDQRCAVENDELRAQMNNEDVRERTGCALHPMYFPARLLWLKRHAPEIYKRAARIVSIKEFVLTELFGAQVVDRSMASGSGAWNMKLCDWDYELLDSIGIGDARFSECVEPTSIVGGLKAQYASAMGLDEGTPAIVGAADGALAHLGTAGLAPTRMSCSVGTSIALRIHSSIPKVTRGSEAWCYYLAEGHWLRGGVAHGGGNALRWFATNLLGVDPDNEGDVFNRMNELASHAPAGAGGIQFFPLFGGERCPSYRPQARATITGLSFSHGTSELTRALYEGIAFCIRAIYRMLANDSNPDLIATGGILKSSVWLQIVADVLGQPLWHPRIDESAAWGGAILGLKAIGAYPDLQAACSALTGGLNYSTEPVPSEHTKYAQIMKSYESAYERLYAN
jgi:gluconokinase